MPSHQNVWCGNRLVWFQEIFWVRNQREPASARRSAGARRSSRRSRAARPRGSRRRTPRGRTACRHELPGHRLAAGHVGVGLDPHAADRHEPSLGHPAPDALEQLGVVLAASTRTAAPRSRRTRGRGRCPSARARWRTCGRTCGRSPGAATARRSRCARGRRRRRGARWRERVGPARRRGRTRPAAAVPATSHGSTASAMSSSARRTFARRGRSAGSCPSRPRRVRTSCSSSHTVRSSSTTWTPPKR